ncbi:tRNA (N(6)-L-threonylcarbamoyladenosine(37)-C(2))-methylthiotransferase MtaB [Anaerostipes sp. MSJ-23]|uniref:tRNA (N(6)-L-threonylcarbamoyladenosine(37)-C(2))- methylthiotransferase MtaB n=1 Tax=Anaerostipes sp. MSJ-23 TaxID=2841520 RepID=UPI001C113E1D|nr:tRNA (N(6)-L-threonylcarbamoyladenosine(37)-C(2))-methylthiotransferase MtaB [Anaerostipes sp. MSJ-23]MBU5460144.1 tRNA (N(6)-L-threonylcarbamoyladenosine(37)-C(2))-methylthiotransferase MtaB [Anaerostipes sp. MSJ-23]
MNLQGKKAAIVTLGCKVNQYETDAMSGMLEKAGVIMVDAKEPADIYIVNTCSVTNMAERKSRQMLHRARKKNSHVVVVAVGCYAQVGKEELAKDENIDLIIGNNKKKELIKILSDYVPNDDADLEVEDIASDKEYETLSIDHLETHTRAYIKVQDGCNQFCSYCIIPYARGRVRSRKKEEVLCEIEELAKKGCQEFVITGIHVTSYGKDLENISLIDLLEKIGQIEGVKRIRLGSLEPGFITEDVVKRLSAMENFCPHFHLSLQSGCDTVLKRMNRRYTTKEIKEKCKLLRKYFKDPALTTDIIVGFPGETQEEFEQTEKFLEEINLYEMHIFKYSKRKGTKAAQMDHQVNDQEKAKRSSVLLAMSKMHQKDFENKQLGQPKEILIEEALHGRDGWYIGHTREYIKTAVQSEVPLENQIIHAVLKQISKDGYVEGEIVSAQGNC